MKKLTRGVLLLTSLITLTSTFAKGPVVVPPPSFMAKARALTVAPAAATNNAAQAATTNAIPALPTPNPAVTNNASIATPTPPATNVVPAPAVAQNGKLPLVAKIIVSDSREVRFYADPQIASTVNLENVLANELAMQSRQQQATVAAPAGTQQQPQAATVQPQAVTPSQYGQYGQQGQGRPIPPRPYPGKIGSATLIFNRSAWQWYEVPDGSVREYLESHQGSTAGGGQQGGFGYNDQEEQQVVPASYVTRQGQWRGQRPFVGGRSGSDLLGGLATVEVEGGVYAQPVSRQKWTFPPANTQVFRGTWPPPRR